MASDYVRLTGMFKTSNPKCYSGTIHGEGIDNLIKGLREAKETDQAVVLFCFLNKSTDKVPMALTYKLGEANPGAQRRQQPSRANRQGGNSRGGYQSGYKKREPEIPLEDPIDDGFGDDPGFTVEEF